MHTRSKLIGPMQTFRTRTHRYKIARKLAKGAYGVVYHAINMQTDREVAVKVMKRKDYIAQDLEEIAILRHLKHARIIKLLDTGAQFGLLFLVFPLYDRELSKLCLNIGLPPAAVIKYGRQLLEGLVYVHTQRVLHRDLKPDNLLLDQDDNLVMIDFGISAEQRERQPGQLPGSQYDLPANTLWYRPLEVLLSDNVYGLPVDMWAVGCIVAELTMGHPLFSTAMTDIEQIFQIYYRFGTPEDTHILASYPHYSKRHPQYMRRSIYDLLPTLDSQLLEFLHRCFDYDPSTRITATQALALPIFSH